MRMQIIQKRVLLGFLIKTHFFTLRNSTFGGSNCDTSIGEISISSSLLEFLEGLFLEFGLLLVGPTVAGGGTAV